MTDHLRNFLVVSLAFIVANSVTLGFVLPLQALLLSGSKLEIGLLFLPHGVRILAFYFYGWRAIFYMLPSSYLFMLLTNGIGAQLDILSPLVSMIACYAGFIAGAAVITGQKKQLSFRMWKFFVIVGAISSLFNGIALSWLQHSGAKILSTLGYMIGDVAGLVACFIILMYAFRFIRILKLNETK